ncbi:MAG: hypothetical protein D6766_10520 [Verrucomicrobia bacterium]|nr:MAG: hypothetical protein D6766_10520 [Verrucomicrobiota bacterium]
MVDTSQQAGHSGQDLNLNNINARLTFRACMAELTLHFGHYGGNVNLEINGELANVGAPSDLDGKTLGGATIHVFMTDATKGRLQVVGIIETMAIGGQELWIDHICPTPCEPAN